MENITENKADQIIKVVCEYYKQKIENVFLISREKDYVKCRQISMYFMRKHLALSFKIIGEQFPGINGYLDHATVMHAIKTVNNLCDTDKQYARDVNTIDSILKNKAGYETPEKLRERLLLFEKEQLKDEIVRLNNRIMMLEAEIRNMKPEKVEPEMKPIKVETKQLDNLKEVLEIKEPAERTEIKRVSPYASIPAYNTGVYSGYVKHCVNL